MFLPEIKINNSKYKNANVSLKTLTERDPIFLEASVKMTDVIAQQRAVTRAAISPM